MPFKGKSARKDTFLAKEMTQGGLQPHLRRLLREEGFSLTSAQVCQSGYSMGDTPFLLLDLLTGTELAKTSDSSQSRCFRSFLT